MPRAWIIGLGAAAAAATLLVALRDVLFPIFLAFGLAYALDPIADWLEKRGVPRTLAVGGLMGAAAGVMLLLALLILPGLVAQAAELSRHLPDYLELAAARASEWAGRWGLPVPHTQAEMVQRLKEWLRGVSWGALLPVGRFVGRFFSSAAGMLVGALNLVVVPVVFFYFLRDISLIRRATIRLAPVRLQKEFTRRLDQADRVFSGYMRGQLFVALVLAALYSGGLGIAGVRFGVVIGAVSGLLNIVPYVGVLAGMGLSLVMVAVDGQGMPGLAGVLIVFGIAQFLEGFVITPRLVGDRVGLGTVETIVALMVGGEMGGLAGLVLAIPVAGCLKTYILDGLAAYRRSQAYQARIATIAMSKEEMP